MYEAVKRVSDWRKFGKWLLQGSKLFGGWLLLLRDESKLDAIHRQHGPCEETCLKAVIEAFLRGEGYQPSWRRVIHALYKAGENLIAHDIIAYAEPVEGEYENVCVCVHVHVHVCVFVWYSN